MLSLGVEIFFLDDKQKKYRFAQLIYAIIISI